MPSNSTGTIAIWKDATNVAIVNLSPADAGVRIRQVNAPTTTVKLPKAQPTDGDSYEVVDADGSASATNAIVILPPAGTTIRGMASFSIEAAFDSVRLTFDSAADDWTADVSSGSSGAQTDVHDLLWRFGAVDHGNVFGDWASLGATIATLKGTKRVGCDSSGGALHITAGNWAGITDVAFVGAGGSPIQAAILVDDGAHFISPQNITQRGVIIDQLGASPFVVATALLFWELLDSSQIATASGQPVIQAGAHTVDIVMDRGSKIAANALSGNDAGSTFNVSSYGGSTLASGAHIGGLGALNLTVDGASQRSTSITQSVVPTRKFLDPQSSFPYFPIDGVSDDWPAMIAVLKEATTAGVPLHLMATTESGIPATIQCATPPAVRDIPDNAHIVCEPGVKINCTLNAAVFADVPFLRSNNLSNQTTLASQVVQGSNVLALAAQGTLVVGTDTVLSGAAAGELEAGYTLRSIGMGWVGTTDVTAAGLYGVGGTLDGTTLAFNVNGLGTVGFVLNGATTSATESALLNFIRTATPNWAFTQVSVGGATGKELVLTASTSIVVAGGPGTSAAALGLLAPTIIVSAITDRPILKPFPFGSTVAASDGFVYNLRIEGNGAIVSGTFARFVEVAWGRDCHIGGFRFDGVTQASVLASYDYGSVNCSFYNMRATNVSGVNWGFSIEDGEFSWIKDSYLDGTNGFILNETDGCWVEDCVSENANSTGFACVTEGAAIYGTHNSGFYRCRAISAATDGFQINTGVSVDVEDCQAQYCAGNGVNALNGSSKVNVRGGRFTDNSGLGITEDAAGSIYVADDVVVGNNAGGDIAPIVGAIPGFGSYFVPSQLPGVVLWLRSDLDVTHAATASAWADQSGYRNNELQAAGGSRPAYIGSDPNFGGLPSLNAAAGKWMDIAGNLVPAWTAAPPWWLWTVMRVNTPSVSGAWLSTNAVGAAGNPECRLDDATGVAPQVLNTTVSAQWLTSIVGLTKAVFAFDDGAKLGISVSNAPAVTTAYVPLAYAAADCSILARPGGALPFNNKVVEYVMGLGRLPTTAQLAQLQAYAVRRYGSA